MKVVLVSVPLITTKFPPLSIALLAGQMLADGHSVKCFDFNIQTYHSVSDDLKEYWTYYKGFQWMDNSHFKDYIYPNIIQKNLKTWAITILKENPDIVGISVNEAPSGKHLARVLKLINPKIKIVIGGPRCSKIYDDTTFRPSEIVDAVVHNEGELTLSELVKSYEEHGKFMPVLGASIRGENGEIIYNGLRERAMDLDLMPYPYFDDFDFSTYLDVDTIHNGEFVSTLPFYTSRGCPARCNFCMDYKMWDVYYRQKSPKRIAEEMIYLSKRYNIKDFHLIELIFNGHHKKMLELCQYLIEADMGIQFFGHGRIDPRLDLESLSILKKAGFRWFIFGLETASNKLLKSMRKGYGKDAASRVLKNMEQVGLDCSVNIITGLPGETWGDFFETLQFLFEHRHCISSVPAVSECVLIPGTDIALDPKKFGIAVDSEGKAPSYDWTSEDGENTIQVRLMRKEIIFKLAKEWKWGKAAREELALLPTLTA